MISFEEIIGKMKPITLKLKIFLNRKDITILVDFEGPTILWTFILQDN